MIPRIKHIEPRKDYVLYVIFDDRKKVLYDIKDDIRNIIKLLNVTVNRAMENLCIPADEQKK